MDILVVVYEMILVLSDQLYAIAESTSDRN